MRTPQRWTGRLLRQTLEIPFAAAIAVGLMGPGRTAMAGPPQSVGIARDSTFNVFLEAGGGYRLSPDSMALSSPFLLARMQPEINRQISPRWSANAWGELSGTPYPRHGSDWNVELGSAVTCKPRGALFFGITVDGGYYRLSEPLMNDPWEYVLVGGRGEIGVGNLNSLSVQYAYNAVNALPYWTNRHTIRLQGAVRPRSWISATAKAGAAFARSEVIHVAGSWDSVATYAEFPVSVAGTVAAGGKNAFSLLCQGQWRKYTMVLTRPGPGSSPAVTAASHEHAFVGSASLLYCREITQRIDLYADCSYLCRTWRDGPEAQNTLRFSVSVEWHLRNL